MNVFPIIQYKKPTLDGYIYFLLSFGFCTFFPCIVQAGFTTVFSIKDRLNYFVCMCALIVLNHNESKPCYVVINGHNYIILLKLDILGEV